MKSFKVLECIFPTTTWRGWRYEKCQQNQQFWEYMLNPLTVWRINWPFRLFNSRFQYKPLGSVFTHRWLYSVCIFCLLLIYTYLLFLYLPFFSSTLLCLIILDTQVIASWFRPLPLLWEYKIRQGRKTGLSTSVSPFISWDHFSWLSCLPVCWPLWVLRGNDQHCVTSVDS